MKIKPFTNFWIIALLLFLSEAVCAQWTNLTPMPEPVSNNAVVGVTNGAGQFVYSFSGISTGKTWQDIHSKNFKYDVNSETWSGLPNLPKGNGRIAAGASYLKGKIYVVGGYEVFANGSERSFNNVHVFNPEVDTFERDAANTILPIDDHVQATWKDSLLYVISGWSNAGNVANVQIYNPTTDEWKAGTPVPNSTPFKVFGASGVIIGDTIYYSGGARQLNNFPATNYFRKGAIDPSDPYTISWSIEEDDRAIGYRMASSSYKDNPFWLGGSTTTYNFDGIAYNGSGGVSPTDLFRLYDPVNNTWRINKNAIPHIMDFRGIAKLDQSTFIIAGGMNDQQEVIGQCIKLDLDNLVNVIDVDISIPPIFPNPTMGYFEIPAFAQGPIKIFDRLGNEMTYSITKDNYIDISHLKAGLYFITYRLGDQRISHKIIKS